LNNWRNDIGWNSWNNYLLIYEKKKRKWEQGIKENLKREPLAVMEGEPPK